jgi:uncharacterized protein YdaL
VRIRAVLSAACAALFAVAPAPAASTLVLYDSTGAWSYLGETYGVMARHLASRFGSVSNLPVAQYRSRMLTNFTATIYIGSTFDEPLPTNFLADVESGVRPVLWVNHNIWQLTARNPAFADTYGWMWWQYDAGPYTGVVYKGRGLTRSPNETSGIMAYSVLGTNVAVVGQAAKADGTLAPWAVRSRHLTYLGEIPFSYISERDRYLAFSDLLFDLLAPATAERHRALVRLEDVGPNADTNDLRRIADYFYSNAIPYSIACYPTYKDPYGVNNGGVPVTLELKKGTPVANTLKYMTQRGATIISHGWTHQYGTLINPYDGVSGNDFEFYRAHVDTNTDYVVLNGPIPGETLASAKTRISTARSKIASAGLPTPTIFEFPHYAGSVNSYKAAKAYYATRYERGLYFPGVLRGGTVRYDQLFGQFFPYVVTDLYASKVIPENLGNIEPDGYNQHPPRLPADLIAAAEANLVVRDGFASFFYHPFLGVDYLKQTIEGIRALGYTFVSPADALK